MNIKNEDGHVVLVYKLSNNDDIVLKRKYFEENLKETGLILTYDKEDKLNFVKIHAPQDVLCHYCELMQFRMPIKKVINRLFGIPLTLLFKDSWFERNI